MWGHTKRGRWLSKQERDLHHHQVRLSGFLAILTAAIGLYASLAALPAASAQAAPATSATLVGKWNLDSWNLFNTKVSKLRPYIIFRAGSSAELFDGCYSYDARYEMAGGKLAISDVSRRSGGCGAMANDQYFKPVTGFYAPTLAHSPGSATIMGKRLTFSNSSDQFNFDSANAASTGAATSTATPKTQLSPSSSLASVFTAQQTMRIGDTREPVSDAFYTCFANRFGQNFQRWAAKTSGKGRAITRQQVLGFLTSSVNRDLEVSSSCSTRDNSEGGSVNLQRLIQALEAA